MKGVVIVAALVGIALAVVFIYFLATANTRSDARQRDVKRWKRQALYADERIHAIEQAVNQWWDDTSILAQSVREEITKYREDQRKKESE